MGYRDHEKMAGEGPIEAISRRGNLEPVAGLSPPRDLPQVEISANRLASLASSLLAKMHEIDQKLSPVLRPLAGAEGFGGKPTTQVPLAAELDDIGDKIEQALECGKSILDRLEL